MTCMVQSAPSAVHQEQEDLLDALLASCQKSAMNSPLPSFGRQLRPYFEDFQGPVVLHDKKALPKKEKKAAKAKTLPPPVVRAAIDSAKATAGKTTSAKIPDKKPPIAPKRPVAPKAAFMDDLFAWAGPGFCVAPPPEQLPTPTSFLLG